MPISDWMKNVFNLKEHNWLYDVNNDCFINAQELMIKINAEYYSELALIDKFFNSPNLNCSDHDKFEISLYNFLNYIEINFRHVKLKQLKRGKTWYGQFD